MNFSRKDVQNFSILCPLPSKHNISTTIAPNRPRPGPLDTRHPELSIHVKFEENGVWKGLQTAAQRLGQKYIYIYIYIK